jgi:lysophospholipase L1-like esterase
MPPVSRRPRALRHPLLLLALVVVACAALVPAAPTTPRLAAASGPASQPTAGPSRVLFVGASVTRGYYSTGVSDAYPAELDQLLIAAGRPVRATVVAHPGARVAEAAVWPLAGDQAIIVVHLVTNDFRRSTPLGSYRASYDRLLERLRSDSPRARLLCLGDWGPPVAVNDIGVPAVDYDAVIDAACQDRGGVFVPLSQLYADPRNRGPAGRPTPFGPSDPFHPNDTGQLAIARTVLAGLDGSSPVEALPPVPRSGVPSTPAPVNVQRHGEGLTGPIREPAPSPPPAVSAVAAHR